jgi:hypothetical protein
MIRAVKLGVHTEQSVSALVTAGVNERDGFLIYSFLQASRAGACL